MVWKANEYKDTAIEGKCPTKKNCSTKYERVKQEKCQNSILSAYFIYYI